MVEYPCGDTANEYCSYWKVSNCRTVGLAKGVMVRRIIVSACILSVLVSAAMLAGCGSGGSTAQTPEQAVKTFFAAYQKLDANTTWNMLSANSMKSVQKKDWEEFLKKLTGPTKYTIGKVTVNGDKATAKVTGTISGKTSTADVPLIKENGVWKVDMAAVSNSTTQ